MPAGEQSSGLIYAPWRLDYIKGLAQSVPGKSSGCFLCDAATVNSEAAAIARLVLWATPLSVALLNRYPYTNGHILIAPLAHKAELEELTAAELLDMQQQTVLAVRLLRRAVSAQGFNIGINMGRCAGAGVPGHIHQHIVPRWGGDVNFMSVVGEVRIVPQALSQMYQELIRVKPGIAPAEIAPAEIAPTPGSETGSHASSHAPWQE